MLPRGLIVAALVAVVAAGCGADDDAALERAADVTRSAATARVGWHVTTSGFGLPDRVTVRGAGTTALDAARMDLRFDVSPLLGLAGAREARGSARVVVRGGDLYVRPPRVRGLTLPGGARWLALDLGRALAATGDAAAGLADVLTLDPGAQIDALHAAEKLEEVGSERVGGARTTRYRGQVDLAEYAKGLPAGRRADAERAIAEFSAETGGEQAQPFEVWIDEDARVRRMRQTTRVPAQPGVPQGQVGITMELSGFGAAVRARPPAARDTYDATSTVSDALEASQ